MAKLINVSNDVYKALTDLKGEKSYSEVIRGFIESRSNKEQILKFFGKGGIDEKKIKELSSQWKKWSDAYV